MNFKKIIWMGGLLPLYFTQGIFAGEDNLQSLIFPGKKEIAVSTIKPEQIREASGSIMSTLAPEIHVEKLENCAVSNETTEIILNVRASSRFPVALQQVQVTFQIQDQIQTKSLNESTDVLLPGRNRKISLSFDVPNIMGNHSVFVHVSFQGKKIHTKEAILCISKKNNEEEPVTNDYHMLMLEKSLAGQVSQENAAMIARMKEMIARLENITIDPEVEKQKERKLALKNIEREHRPEIARGEPGRVVVQVPEGAYMNENRPCIIIPESNLRSENILRGMSMFGMVGTGRIPYQRVPFSNEEEKFWNGTSTHLFNIPKGTYKMTFKTESRYASEFGITMTQPTVVWSSSGNYNTGYDCSLIRCASSLRLQGIWGTVNVPFYCICEEDEISLRRAYLTQFEIDLKNGIYQDSFGNYVTGLTGLNPEDTYQVYFSLDTLGARSYTNSDYKLYFKFKGHNEFM